MEPLRSFYFYSFIVPLELGYKDLKTNSKSQLIFSTTSLVLDISGIPPFLHDLVD